MELLEPIEKEIDGKMFILSKFPAIAGREIITNYPASAMPKVGDYKTNEKMMLKLMSFVAIQKPGMERPIRLVTDALIDNHAGNWETLAKIEVAMMEYNCSFFQNGRVSTFLNDIAQKVPAWISKTLIVLSAQLSQTEKQRSTN